MVKVFEYLHVYISSFLFLLLFTPYVVFMRETSQFLFSPHVFLFLILVRVILSFDHFLCVFICCCESFSWLSGFTQSHSDIMLIFWSLELCWYLFSWSCEFCSLCFQDQLLKAGKKFGIWTRSLPLVLLIQLCKKNEVFSVLLQGQIKKQGTKISTGIETAKYNEDRWFFMH